MARQGTTYRIGTGATSLLMVLVILCLTALSVLSYTSARSEKKLAERSAQVAQSVQAAENEAQRTLAQLDACIAQARLSAGSTEGLAEAVDSLLPDNVMRDGESLSFDVPATEQLTLHVAIRLEPPASTTRYTVTAFMTQAVPAGFDEAQTLELFN